MKRILIVLSVAVVGLASCKQFKKGEGDMLYKIYTDKEGATIQDGDFVAFKAIEKTEEDSVMYSSYDYDRPSLLVKEKSVFKGDLFAALAMLSEGDSATFKINIDSMQNKMGRPKPENTKGKYLVYDIKIDKVIPKGKLNDSIFRTQIDTYMKGEMDKAKTSEAGKIKTYINKEGLKTQTTASGLIYSIEKEGNGPKATTGDTVQVNYTGRFLSGKVFDTSYPDVAKKSGTFNAMRTYEPIKTPVGVSASIPGFDEALMLLPKGTKATVVMPSNLAYGEQGNQGIPPFTPLIFDLEIVNIIKAKPAGAANVSPTPATTPAN